MRDDLDRVSTTTPIAVTHISGHLTVVNSKALELLHFDRTTPDPSGGVIRRRPGSREPNGVLEEHAAFAIMPYVMNSNPADPGVLQRLQAAALQYASFGITTGQEDFADASMMRTLEAAATTGLLTFDVIAFPTWKVADAELKGYDASPHYQHHLRRGGVKIILDGSLQGYTGYLTTPYFHSESRGYPAMPQRSTAPSRTSSSAAGTSRLTRTATPRAISSSSRSPPHARHSPPRRCESR